MSYTNNSELPRSGSRGKKILLATALVIALAILASVAIFMTNRDRPPIAVPSARATPSASAAVPAEDPSPRPSATPEPIGTSPQVINGVSALIGTLSAVDGIAASPGEIAGPSIRVPVTLINTTSAAFPLDSLVISVDYGESRIPASELSGPDVYRLTGEIAPGKSVVGAYVFTVPVADRDLVTVTVDLGADLTPLVFTGKVSA